MAIKYSDLNKKVNLKPLTEEEFAMINEVETHIDEEIIRQFKTSNSVNIFLGTARFDWDPIRKVRREGMKPVRQTLMLTELMNRYKKAKWNVEIKIDDQLDGPNMSGADYMILTGRK
jgi:hypothetical protein